MTITTDQVVQMAQEVGIDERYIKEPYIQVTHEELTALCNKVREQTLLEAAEYCDVAGHFTQAGLMRFMAGVVCC